MLGLQFNEPYFVSQWIKNINCLDKLIPIKNQYKNKKSS